MQGFLSVLTAQQSPTWTDYSLHHPSPHTVQFLSLHLVGPLTKPTEIECPTSLHDLLLQAELQNPRSLS